MENPIDAHSPNHSVINPLNSILIPLRYQNQVFPDGHMPQISEVPAHFDTKGITARGPCCYHTEYSSKIRTFTSPLLEGLNVLKASHRKGVPELWTSPAWALEMAEFVFRLSEGKEPPAIIEIHPPFATSVPTVEAFLDIYAVFEHSVLGRFPNCRFLIENRSGTKHPSEFLISTAESILGVGRALASRSIQLGIALDVAQMFTKHYGSKCLVGPDGAELLKTILPIRDQIHTLHLWGRARNGGAHNGGLDGLFAPDAGAQEACLSVMRNMFNSDLERHLVVEVVNSGILASILEDLRSAGFAC